MSSFKETMVSEFTENNIISPEYYDKYSVTRGLRNPDGTGVMAGVTRIIRPAYKSISHEKEYVDLKNR